MKHFPRIVSIALLVLGSLTSLVAQIDREQGTLVVAVPVDVGLVACADKRLFNADAGTFTDTFVKVRKAGTNAVFAATHTVGFYDRKSKLMAFDAFDVVQDYLDQNPFLNNKQFFDGLKLAITQRIFTYLTGQPYASWPETDTANRGLLFNLIFYSINNGRPYSQTIKVLYEKKRTPVVNVMPPVAELIDSPTLAGKGREVLKFLDRSPSIANDPAILKFDERVFRVSTTNTTDAIEFARKLFALTSTSVPHAQVSATFDCALLDRTTGYRPLPN